MAKLKLVVPVADPHTSDAMSRFMARVSEARERAVARALHSYREQTGRWPLFVQTITGWSGVVAYVLNSTETIIHPSEGQFSDLWSVPADLDPAVVEASR